MTNTIAVIWILTAALLLLAAVFTPRVYRLLHRPSSMWAKCILTVVLFGNGLCALLSLLWDTKLFGTPVSVLASLGLVGYIWGRLLFLRAFCQSRNHEIW